MQEFRTIKLSQINKPSRNREELLTKTRTLSPRYTDILESIKKRGVMTPLAVQETSPGRYKILDGVYRYHAAVEAFGLSGEIRVGLVEFLLTEEQLKQAKKQLERLERQDASHGNLPRTASK